jgi:hypothetical protein
MNKQQRRKDHKKSYTKAFMEAFENMSPKPKKPSYDAITGKKK